MSCTWEMNTTTDTVIHKLSICKWPLNYPLFCMIPNFLNYYNVQWVCGTDFFRLQIFVLSTSACKSQACLVRLCPTQAKEPRVMCQSDIQFFFTSTVHRLPWKVPELNRMEPWTLRLSIDRGGLGPVKQRISPLRFHFIHISTCLWDKREEFSRNPHINIEFCKKGLLKIYYYDFIFLCKLARI